MRRKWGAFAGVVALSALIATTASSGVAGAAPLNRPADPVVLTGAQLPSFATAKPAMLVGFAARTTGWQQIPIQVDERALVNFGRVYHGATNNVNVLSYTSPKTWAGKDPTTTFDANDELAFMARDAGIVSPFASGPAGTLAGSGVQVRIADPTAPGNEGYVYLFRKGPGSKLKPTAGKKYVKYRFKVKSGPYKTTYKYTAGPNPEDSLVTAPYYQHHFSDRWASDRIQITAPSANKADILDRHKALFAPGNCGRSEDTFDAGEGAFVTNTAGPVRVIRSYIGANSGPNTERTHIFYDRREDIRTDLRVHAIPGIMDFFDYSPAAAGMTYRNNLNPGGVTIDGVPDSPVAGAPTWEQVTGAQGSITIVNQLAATFSPSGLTSYYLDDSTPPVTQCTGDSFAYGSSGSYFNGAIPCTDPGTSCADSVSATRVLYFGSPGGTAANATSLSDGVAQPLTTTSTHWP
jgi:hypothetical protein